MNDALTFNLNPINDWISIGTVIKPVGLKGEVRVFVKTDFIHQRFSKGSVVYFQIDGEYKPLEIETFRLYKNMVIVSFKSYTSIESIEFLLQQEVWIQKSKRPELNIDEYYFDQLLHLEVYQDQKYIGKIKEVFEQPASTILRIETDTTTFLLPFVKAFVTRVDLQEGRIEVNLIEGFYED